MTPCAGDWLIQYVIYEHPSDYPDAFVVRRMWVGVGGVQADRHPYAVVSTLELARATIPRGMVCLQRCPDDEPQIREVWT